jgi:hypothetical protein
MLINGRLVQFDLSVIVTGVVGFFVGAAVVFFVTVLGCSRRLASYSHTTDKMEDITGVFLTKFMTQNSTSHSTNRQTRSTSSKQLACIAVLLLLLLLLGVFTTVSSLVVILGRVPRRWDRGSSIVVTTTARLLTTAVGELSRKSPLCAASRCFDEEGAPSAGLPFLDPADGEGRWGVLRRAGGGRSAGVGRARVVGGAAVLFVGRAVVGWAAVLIIGRAVIWRAAVFFVRWAVVGWAAVLVVGRAFVGGPLVRWAFIWRAFAAAAAVVGG